MSREAGFYCVHSQNLACAPVGSSKCALAITDNGCGIDPRDLPHIFDRGFTGNNGRNHSRSTGMGLYLVKKLCEQMGIKVAAHSVGEFCCLNLQYMPDVRQS